jgi:hypothetical protein
MVDWLMWYVTERSHILREHWRLFAAVAQARSRGAAATHWADAGAIADRDEHISGPDVKCASIAGGLV